MATPAMARDYTIKEMSNPYSFQPSTLTIKSGDTVTFVNAQDDMHDVMFIEVPKGVDEMIMSPMHEKKGDKFSYTFTVPGTYKFHCHPHEALGMTGTLIVDTPSKAGETVKMDHHKMSNSQNKSEKKGSLPASSNGAIQASGKINGVNISAHKIDITHAPIKALGWPKMRMELEVDASVDLSQIKPGENVSFTLKPAPNDNFIVMSINK